MVLSAGMEPVPYVNERAAEAVSEFEGRFQRLQASAGVLFVSISAEPVEGGDSHAFFIRLGLTKNLTRDAGWAIIQSVLKRELEAGLKVHASVFIGIAGAAHDSRHAGAHPAPA